MLVEVRPLPINKWHGKKDKEAFSRPKDIEVLYDSSTGRYATGLTKEEAERLGKLLGADLGDTFNPNEPHPYWSSKAATIRLPNQTVFFNTDRPAEFVKVQNLKASKFVANSMKEYNEGLWPDATHVIFDETAETNDKATKIALTDEATLFKMKMSDEDKANMVQILSDKKVSVKGRSTDYINVEISAIIDERPGEFLKYAKMGREEVYVRATVLECLHKNILTKEGGSIYYMGDMIAFDYEEAVQWFKNPQNSKLKVSIFEKLTR